MPKQHNLQAMQSTAADLLAGLLSYIDKHLVNQGSIAYLPYATLHPVDRLEITVQERVRLFGAQFARQLGETGYVGE